MRRKNKRNSGKANIWTESWAYLKETRNYIYFSIGLFLAGMVIGLWFSGFFAKYFDELIRKVIEETSGMSIRELIFFIFQNNVASAFSALMLGILIGIVPIFSILLNGTLLGYVFSKAVAVEGISTLWRIVPHGIFELPAIFIAVGIGIRFGMFWFVKKGNRAEEFRKRFWGGIKVFLTIILPLLVIAAIIEGVLIGFGG